MVDGAPLRASAGIGVAVAEPGALTSDEPPHQADVATGQTERESRVL